jgi:hypothetical protein
VRGAVAEGGVRSVVERFDVVGDGEAGTCSGGESLAVIHLVFQRREERLGGGVIPTHAGAPDARADAFALAVLVKLLRRVLGAAVGAKPNSA